MNCLAVFFSVSGSDKGESGSPLSLLVSLPSNDFKAFANLKEAFKQLEK